MITHRRLLDESGAVRFPPPWRRKMTCCVAAICDKKKTIVLISDKMIGTQMIESEPEITKVISIHTNWRVMFAGNDIAQVFPITNAARLALSRIRRAPTLKQVCNAVYESYVQEREQQAEAIHLAPIGWTLKMLNSPKSSILPESLREELLTKIAAHRVEVGLLVAGFGSTGTAHVFSVDDYEDRGKPRIQDLPGYHAIGSGAEAAMYMMAYREVSAATPLRLALYYAVEGKYFGEKSGGVGTKTDAWVMRSGMRPFKVGAEALEDSLFDLCMKLEPKPIRSKQVDVLNAMSGTTLASIPKLSIKKKDDEWIIEAEKPRNAKGA
jgi:20S proteasome alpha/beta subunit